MKEKFKYAKYLVRRKIRFYYWHLLHIFPCQSPRKCNLLFADLFTHEQRLEMGKPKDDKDE